MTRSQRVTVHAGLPKTGTSYLQRRFVESRAWLAAHGVWYPTVGQEVLDGHHNLATYFQGQPAEDLPWTRLPPREVMNAALDQSSEHILLSSETFCGLDQPGKEALREAFGDRDLEVVVFLRRRSGLCASRWQEEIKHGSTGTFSEFLVDQLLGDGPVDVLRIENPVASLLGAFGVESLRIAVYDNLVEDGADLFEWFVREMLRLPLDGIPPSASPGRLNVSLPPPRVEVLRLLNCVNTIERRCSAVGLRGTALDFLRSNTRGQALLEQVTECFEIDGVDLDLGKLDLQWLGRDHEIMQACGSRFLNARSATEIFRDGTPTTMRVLRPDALYRRLPYSTFEEIYQAVVELCGPSAAETP